MFDLSITETQDDKIFYGELQKASFEVLVQYLNNCIANSNTKEMRLLSDEELGDLSNNWENPFVDVTKYYQSVGRAWEVKEEIYKMYKSHGGLCQKHNGKFYIA